MRLEIEYVCAYFGKVCRYDCTWVGYLRICICVCLCACVIGETVYVSWRNVKVCVEGMRIYVTVRKASDCLWRISKECVYFTHVGT